MARFERSSGRSSRGSSSGRDSARSSSSRRDSNRGPSRRDVGRSSFGESSFSGRDSKRNSHNRRDFEMTRVTCSECGESCEVPFKPTTNKPIYCSECFNKRNKASSDNRSSGYDNKSAGSGKDFEIINAKLDKIMKALDIKY